MRDITVCFTGHRNIPESQVDKTKRLLIAAITGLFDSGNYRFCTGGALGFDTLAAQAILEFKTYHPNIKLILFLPHKRQSKHWSANNKETYNSILNSADEIIYLSESYTAGCMFKRNRALVDNSHICVCYLTEKKGGTYYTVSYAKSKGHPIINIAR